MGGYFTLPVNSKSVRITTSRDTRVRNTSVLELYKIQVCRGKKAEGFLVILNKEAYRTVSHSLIVVDVMVML